MSNQRYKVECEGEVVRDVAEGFLFAYTQRANCVLWPQTNFKLCRMDWTGARTQRLVPLN